MKYLYQVTIVLILMIMIVITNQQCNDGLCSTGLFKIQNLNYTIVPNGCGPSEFEELIPDLNFGDCCNEHDNCYSNCTVDRDTCDENFYQCMLGKCDDLDFDFIGIGERVCRRVAECYASTTHESGCQFWEDAQQEACTCSNNGTDTSFVPRRSPTFSDRVDLDCSFDTAGRSGADSLLMTRLGYLTMIILGIVYVVIIN
jgi:secretory phospholipase A2